MNECEAYVVTKLKKVHVLLLVLRHVMWVFLLSVACTFAHTMFYWFFKEFS